MSHDTQRLRQYQIILTGRTPTPATVCNFPSNLFSKNDINNKCKARIPSPSLYALFSGWAYCFRRQSIAFYSTSLSFAILSRPVRGRHTGKSFPKSLGLRHSLAGSTDQRATCDSVVVLTNYKTKIWNQNTLSLYQATSCLFPGPSEELEIIS